MRQHIMALIKRGMRPSASGNPPILDVDTIIGVVAANPTRVFKIAIAGATDADANAFAFKNPFGVECLVGTTALVVGTGVTSLTIDIGTDADGTGTSDNLLDAAGIGTGEADTLQENVNDGGTNGQAAQVLGANEFITGTASNTATALVATVYVSLTPVTTV